MAILDKTPKTSIIGIADFKKINTLMEKCKENNYIISKEAKTQ
jgi:hypothetical protein